MILFLNKVLDLLENDIKLLVEVPAKAKHHDTRDQHKDWNPIPANHCESSFL